MGTRGAFGFVVNETEKITYNHFDSYPGGLGTDVLGWLHKVIDGSAEDAAREAAARLRVVDEDAAPTEEEWKRYSQAGLADTGVSTGADWYSLLRNAQGDPAALLDLGVCTDGSQFPLYSLFCEWAYVVDFDQRTFEVYRGFRTTPPTAGRWAGRADVKWGECYPVERVASWSFDALPGDLDENELSRD